jgi:hypothetical protein
MLKASTPGDRKFAQKELPVLMTQLEMALPQTWNTTVAHIYTFHSIIIQMLAGPFCVSNMFKVRAHTRCTQTPYRTPSDYRTTSDFQTAYFVLACTD